MLNNSLYFKNIPKIYLKVIGLYVISRIILLILGLKMVLLPHMMPFMDINWLSENYWESLYMYHLMPPLNNAIYGGLHIMFGDYFNLAATILFLIFGIILSVSFAKLLEIFGLKENLIVLICMAFMLTPATIYFETFFLYTYPTAAVFALLTVYFWKFTHAPTIKNAIVIAIMAAFLCLIRSIFHLVWILPLVLFLFGYAKWNLKILAISALPFLLVVGLYAKNAIEFDFFGASSWFGSAVSKQTIYRIPEDGRMALIKKQKIHPIFEYNVYASPEEMKSFFDLSKSMGSEATDSPRKSDGYVNYNHWSYIEASKMRKKDAVNYIKENPLKYGVFVLKNVRDFFSPTTTWHPLDDGINNSPHQSNREKIGSYERAYNFILHSIPIPKMGIYALIIPAFFLAFFIVIYNIIRGSKDKKDYLLLFMGLNMGFVTMVSILIEKSELERYRYLIEPMIWLYCLDIIVRRKEYMNTLKSLLWRSK